MDEREGRRGIVRNIGETFWGRRFRSFHSSSALMMTREMMMMEEGKVSEKGASFVPMKDFWNSISIQRCWPILHGKIDFDCQGFKCKG